VRHQNLVVDIVAGNGFDWQDQSETVDKGICTKEINALIEDLLWDENVQN
jgi:hypothetical protein